MADRKLRPLYEAIDEGHNKEALQLANKILKKTPDFVLVKALKALALVRSGKEDEASDLCAQVKASQPIDEPTLQAATMAYKEIGQHDQVVHLYEAAAKLQPNNEEFANHWFMAMVRGKDLKGQQQAALKLHKTFKNNKYLFWAIMSLALQGEAAKGTTPNLSYTLAERMMSKALEEGRVKQTEELRLYLLILIGQSKQKEALALLDSEIGQKSLLDPEVRQIYVELMTETNEWARAYEACRKVLSEQNSDDWISWKTFFDALFKNIAENPESEQAKLEEAKALIESTKKSALEASILKRGPFMAELELDLRLKQDSKIDGQIMLEHIKIYFDRFGTKPCCFEDLQPYLNAVLDNEEAVSGLITDLRSLVHLDVEDIGTKIKNIQKDINVYKLELYLGASDNGTEQGAVKKVTELWTAYNSALPLGTTLEKTERQYGDDYVVLASHILLKKYRETEDIAFFLHALVLLETALAKSIHNFQFKMLLIRLYLSIGAFDQAHRIFSTMDIKHIQFDTLTHYLSDRSISLGQFDQLAETLSMACSIYKANEIETPEMIVKAYQYATFSKIQEFIEFRSRLDQSIQHTVFNIDLARVEALQASFAAKYGVQFFAELDPSVYPHDDERISKLSDNRDYGVMTDCTPDDQTSIEELSRPSKRTNPNWVKIQSLILRTMHNICDSNCQDLEIATELKAAVSNKDIIKDVTEQEVFLGQFIANVVEGISHLKNAEADKQQKGIELLEQCNLSTFITSHKALTDTTISWNYFHQTLVEVETLVYGSILSEVIKRTLSLGKKKKSDPADASDTVKAAHQFHSMVKDGFIELQKKTRQSKDTVKPQLQKALLKRLTEHGTLGEFYQTKDHQNSLSDILKRLVSGWNSSVQVYLEEIDKRLQKL
ncbi:N-acetyltransferase B complex non catalytic subunit-domain-containing protein [Umbelopsis sp. PMI_123]|nr:N-acetyltransferase B complex non catalytic subunit-domain-containing protein [Umbelopsis sp. PMI_123]